MISVIRIDDRLLHGQVALLWTQTYSIHTVVIVNDKVVNDEFLKMTLGLAKPIGVELKIISVADGIAYMREQMETTRRVMVIINNLLDAKRIFDELDLPSLNFGNLRERADSARYAPAISLTSEDIEICKYLLDKGVELEIRRTPDESKTLIKKLLNK
ncbi:MAG TPA: PTS sugar transporter subunit IIB [Erysipelotrichaceae bacterium]|jgi:fructoselysine and glucoselysine-specific PTS system IIB component|nr:PTS sugar transporter subunit IIB [Erysipelotrichaceae bacterium]HQA85029.1 PTS sugar transporter subunit IIB [Erysipelotrichaceae bacterium]